MKLACLKVKQTLIWCLCCARFHFKWKHSPRKDFFFSINLIGNYSTDQSIYLYLLLCGLEMSIISIFPLVSSFMQRIAGDRPSGWLLSWCHSEICIWMNDRPLNEWMHARMNEFESPYQNDWLRHKLFIAHFANILRG